MSNRPGQVITSDIVTKMVPEQGSKFIEEEQLKGRKKRRKKKKK